MKLSALTLTVSQLNEYVKAIFDSTENFHDIYIKGEISNFTNHYKSGHLYFSLKDDASVLKCVMFRSSAINLAFMPENGMKVIVRGHISVFMRDGVYQLYAEDIQPDGIGSLYLAYEQLKEKLAMNGLFNEEFKKPIPRFPSKIGIITAQDGAAVADMKNILTRRYPIAEIIIYPSLVQGASAAKNLIQGIKYFNSHKSVDTIIIGRGGGSIEDLWAFNNEELAYAVFESEIPVISAVGHETDFTICDFVSDLRAPTPSAAAELAVPDILDILYTISTYYPMFSSLIQRRITEYKNALDAIASSRMFKKPLSYTQRLKERSELFKTSINRSINSKISSEKQKLSEAVTRLSALNPLSVLARGYSIVTTTDGKVISDVSNTEIGSEIRIRLNRGSVTATVTDKKEEKDAGKKAAGNHS